MANKEIIEGISELIYTIISECINQSMTKRQIAHLSKKEA
jgi:hypothetical protein